MKINKLYSCLPRADTVYPRPSPFFILLQINTQGSAANKHRERLSRSNQYFSAMSFEIRRGLEIFRLTIRVERLSFLTFFNRGRNLSERGDGSGERKGGMVEVVPTVNV